MYIEGRGPDNPHTRTAQHFEKNNVTKGKGWGDMWNLRRYGLDRSAQFWTRNRRPGRHVLKWRQVKYCGL